MKTLQYLLMFLFFFLSQIIQAQFDYMVVTQSELNQMNTALETDSNFVRLCSWFGEPEELYVSYKENKHKADSIWELEQKTLPQMTHLGTTERFELLPLIDWFTSGDSLTGEAGVSYLLRTDHSTILFDLGMNARDTHPSSLLKNMEQLGVSLDDIDMIVISHNHGDHVGGHKWWRQNSFSLSGDQIELPAIPVYTPNEMQYPGLTPTYTPKPTKIAEGVATIGVIHNPCFFVDVAEQAIAVNVKDKGMVVISGCGHQSIAKMMQRSSILFDEPIYAVLGGFHYPVEESRNISWMYKYFVMDKLPWEDFTLEDVIANIGLLKEKNVQVVGISGHDSCDKSIAEFKKVFKESYLDIAVGKELVLGK